MLGRAPRVLGTYWGHFSAIGARTEHCIDAAARNLRLWHLEELLSVCCLSLALAGLEWTAAGERLRYMLELT